MAINRQNYEEYFLMYVDEELSIHQRMEVEWFAQQNPDLAEELEMLKEARLLPDEAIVFKNKEALLKIAEGPVNLTNYEEYFLLYIDRELDEEERKIVEKFLQHNPQLQTEFNLLQQTVSFPEPVVFENKAMLYRHKSDERKVVVMNWWRIAVAAVLLFAIAGLWIMLPKGDKADQQAAVVKPAKENSTKPLDSLTLPVATVKQPIQKIIEEQTASVTKQPVIKKTQQVNATSAATKNKREFVVSKSEKQDPLIAVVPKEKEEVAVNNNKPVEENTDPFTTKAHVEKSINSVELATAVKKKIDAAINSSATLLTANNIESNYAKPVVYKELNTDENEDKQTVYLGSMQVNKSKLKGFLKKASRIFGNKNEEETNGKLQIANFEIDKENK